MAEPMAAATRQSGRDREAAIVAAYQAGRKLAEIEAEFGVGRSTIYHYLERAGQLPARSQRRIREQAKDAALAGLYELIHFQDQRIIEQDAEIDRLRKVVVKYERAAKRAAGGRGTRAFSNGDRAV